MKTELESIARQLSQARKPEDVFGTGPESTEDLLPAVRNSYHALVKILHPDLYDEPDDKILAHIMLGQLLEWLGKAQEAIKYGTYGQKTMNSTDLADWI